MESWLTVEHVEIGADQLTILHADAGIVDEVGNAARGIDLIIWTARGAGFRLDDLDAVLEHLLGYENTRQSGIGRSICYVKLHQ